MKKKKPLFPEYTPPPPCVRCGMSAYVYFKSENLCTKCYEAHFKRKPDKPDEREIEAIPF